MEIVLHPNQSMEQITALISPETSLEQQIMQDVLWQKGVFWGKPRKGHPEGLVLYHIKEVLDNVDKLTHIDALTRQHLRLITLIHDTFKFQEDLSFPRDWSKHHAIYARKFAERYLTLPFLLDIIEWHDEAYYSWRWSEKRFRKRKGQKKLRKLLKCINHHTQLYYLFFKCDTQTGNKTQAPVQWFEQQVDNIEIIHF